MAAKKKEDLKVISLLEELHDKLDALSEENRDLKQMVGQLGHNLDLMRGERTTGPSNRAYTGSGRPEDLPEEAPKRLCPQCFGTMRWVRNSNDGSVFAGCRKFPDCRGTRRKEQAQSEVGLKFDLESKARRDAEENESDPDPEASAPWAAETDEAPF